MAFLLQAGTCHEPLPCSSAEFCAASFMCEVLSHQYLSKIVQQSYPIVSLWLVDHMQMDSFIYNRIREYHHLRCTAVSVYFNYTAVPYFTAFAYAHDPVIIYTIQRSSIW